MTGDTPQRLSEMKNLGPVTERQLRAVGIDRPQDLVRIGPVEAYLRLREAFPGRITSVALYALQGALLDERWNALPDELRARLRVAAASPQRQPPNPR